MHPDVATTARRTSRRLAVVAPLTLGLTLAVGSTAFAAPSVHAAPAAQAAASTTASDHVTQGTAATVGDPTKPQPLSNADTNTGGANGQCGGTADTNGIYCSTRDGSPSPNGNGDGAATGKPCMGCVGKADNKNPPGQEAKDPMGTFPNNGYECDHNNGIGKGNPAHTGCTGTTTVTTCPTGQTMVNGTCTTPVVVTTCPTGQTMVNGTCTTPATSGDNEQGGTICSSGQVMVAGTCTTPVTGGTTSTGGTTPTVGGTTSTGGTTPVVEGTKTTGGTPEVGGTTTGGNAGGATVEGVKVAKPAKTPTSVLGERIVRTAPGAAVAPATVTALPFTGVNTGELVASALLMFVVGLPLLVGGTRRKRA